MCNDVSTGEKQFMKTWRVLIGSTWRWLYFEFYTSSCWIKPNGPTLLSGKLRRRVVGGEKGYIGQRDHVPVLDIVHARVVVGSNLTLVTCSRVNQMNVCMNRDIIF